MTARMRTRRIALTLLVALAMVAASCGDDGGDDETTDGAVEASDAAATDTDDADSAPEDDATADADADVTDAGDDEPVELTATDIGVTESVIRVGAVFPDTSLLQRDPGDLEAKFQTIVDAINADGGINGRTIELHIRLVNPLDDLGYDEACVEFTGDIGVFAAVGLFPRENADCYATLNDTIVVNTFAITEAQMASYTAPGLTIVAHPSRLVEARVAALIDAGQLSEGSSIAIHGADGTRAAHEQYRDAFEAAGVSVVADTVAIADGTDLLALQSEMAAFTEVWRSEGAEAVVATSSLVSQAIVIAYTENNVELPILLPEGTGVAPSLLQDQLGLDLSAFEFATALVAGNDQATKYETGEDGVRECVDAFEAASGEEVALDESRNNLGPTIVACQVFDIFTAIADAAGPELTTESFAAAAEAFGPIEVTDLPEASVGPDKFDLDDAVGVIAEFNPDTVQFEPVG